MTKLLACAAALDTETSLSAKATPTAAAASEMPRLDITRSRNINRTSEFCYKNPALNRTTEFTSQRIGSKMGIKLVFFT